MQRMMGNIIQVKNIKMHVLTNGTGGQNIQ